MKRLVCGFAALGLLGGLTGRAHAQYTYNTLDVPDDVAVGVNAIRRSSRCWPQNGAGAGIRTASSPSGAATRV
jgi:hypothetical protein